MLLAVPDYIFGALWIILMVESILLIGILINETAIFHRFPRIQRNQREIAGIVIGFSLSFFSSAFLLASDKLLDSLPENYWWKVMLFSFGFGGGILVLLLYGIFYPRRENDGQ